MTRWLVDTSVAVPMVVVSHEAHVLVRDSVRGRPLDIAAHAALETYSVLTRLPGDARVRPQDAARLLRERFAAAVVPTAKTSRGLVDELASLGIAGGAVYDALIAVTARSIDAVLLTRDRRAAATYARLDLAVEIIE